MKKYLLVLLSCCSILGANSLNAQNYTNYNRWGVFGGLGFNNINGSVESEAGVTKSLKGRGSMAPSIGLFYEAAADKNLSITFSGGLTYANFGYSYIGAYNSLSYFKDENENILGLYPDGGGDEIKRNLHSLMVTPQVELNFITDPIFKNTTCLEFRLGLGAAIYTNKKNGNYGELIQVKDNVTSLDYYYTEKVNIGNGTAWGNTYGSLYIGMRFRNTTNELLNRSTVGLQFLLPFNSNRSGGVEINHQAFYWEQHIQKETAKFRLNTIGIKYSYSFRNSY